MLDVAVVVFSTQPLLESVHLRKMPQASQVDGCGSCRQRLERGDNQDWAFAATAPHDAGKTSLWAERLPVEPKVAIVPAAAGSAQRPGKKGADIFPDHHLSDLDAKVADRWIIAADRLRRGRKNILDSRGQATRSQGRTEQGEKQVTHGIRIRLMAAEWRSRIKAPAFMFHLRCA